MATPDHTRRAVLAAASAVTAVAVGGTAEASNRTDAKWRRLEECIRWPHEPHRAAVITALRDARAQGIDPDWITGNYVSFVAPEAGVTYTTPDGQNWQTTVQVSGTGQRGDLAQYQA